MKESNYLGDKQSRFANRGECFMARLAKIWLLQMPEDSASALINVDWSLLIISLRSSWFLRQYFYIIQDNVTVQLHRKGNLPANSKGTAFELSELLVQRNPSFVFCFWNVIALPCLYLRPTGLEMSYGWACKQLASIESRRVSICFDQESEYFFEMPTVLGMVVTDHLQLHQCSAFLHTEGNSPAQ